MHDVCVAIRAYKVSIGVVALFERALDAISLAAVVELRRHRHAGSDTQRAPAHTQPLRQIHQRPRLLAGFCQKSPQDLRGAAPRLVVLGGVLHIPRVIEGRRADRRPRSRREIAQERSRSRPRAVIRARFDEATCAGEEGAEDDVTDNSRGGACAPEIPSAQSAGWLICTRRARAVYNEF